MLQQSEMTITQFIHSPLQLQVATRDEIAMCIHRMTNAGFEDHAIAAAVAWSVADVRHAISKGNHHEEK